MIIMCDISNAHHCLQSLDYKFFFDNAYHEATHLYVIS